MYDIVCFFAGSCHFCIRRRIRYRIRRRMSNIRYRMSKIQYRISNIRYRIRHRIKCAISYVFVAGSCHFYIRRRIRYRIKKYDVVYDIVLKKNSRFYYTISYNNIVCLVAIIRYRTSKSQKTYDVIVRCRMRFFYKYLGWRLQRVALAMPLERPQVLPHDPRPSPMVCTAS